MTMAVFALTEDEVQRAEEAAKPPWQRKFVVGELLPWKGEWFRVTAVGIDGLVVVRKEPKSDNA